MAKSKGASVTLASNHLNSSKDLSYQVLEKTMGKTQLEIDPILVLEAGWEPAVGLGSKDLHPSPATYLLCDIRQFA